MVKLIDSHVGNEPQNNFFGHQSTRRPSLRIPSTTVECSVPRVKAAMSTSKEGNLKTYHCICTNLLLATTFEIASLSRRASPGLDQAHILPCPAPHPHTLQHDGAEHDDALEEVSTSTRSSSDRTVLLSMLATRKVVVRREDGFEKRYPLQCGRCGTTVGYHLDVSQYSVSSNIMEVRQGAKRDVVYILPGSMVTTEAMAGGRLPDEREISLGIAAL